MFERRHQTLLNKKQFALRQLRWICFSLLILAGSLGLGVWGYHIYCQLPWIDSLLNASMILTGMGPVNPMDSDAAKIFASFYALFSGVAFLTMVAVLFAPIFHRFFHKFHVEYEDDWANS